jgi:hypothetical protein
MASFCAEDINLKEFAQRVNIVFLFSVCVWPKKNHAEYA